MYNEIITERFQNLKNAGIVTNADATGQVGTVASGNMIKIYLRIENGTITDAKFKTFGSVYALAASDILCDMLKGRAIEDAFLIKGNDIVEALQGLPDNKMQIADLIEAVIADAVEDYQKKLAKAKLNSEKK